MYRVEKADKLIINALAQDLLRLDIGKLGLHPYSLKYLTNKLKSIHYELYLYYQLLKSVSLGVEKEVHTVSLIDFGGGLGFGSLLAKKLGFKKVVYCDNHEQTLLDAVLIAKALNMEPDLSLLGSTEKFIELKDAKYCLISKDVIEHIYCLDTYFEEINSLKLIEVSAHLTSANPKNIFLKKYFKEIHYKAEFEDVVDDFAKKNAANKSFFQLRKIYIKNNYPNLSQNEIDAFAKKTKGLIYDDIDYFLSNMSKNSLADTKCLSNTCDPETGNWTERLLATDEYSKLANDNHLEMNYFDTLYNKKNRFILTGIAVGLLNTLIRIFGYNLDIIAPCQVFIFRPIISKTKKN